MWKRQPEGGLYDFDLNGWWLPPHPSTGGVGDVFITDRTFGGVFLGEVKEDGP